MQTITIELRNEHALRLLQDLEKLDIIRLVSVPEKRNSVAQRFRGTISKQTATQLQEQLQSMRGEWQRDI